MRAGLRLVVVTVLFVALSGVAPSPASAQTGPLVCSSYTILLSVISVCPGPAGPQGPQGPQGPEGPQGPAGEDGEDGGLAGYEIVDETEFNFSTNDVAFNESASCPSGKVATGGSARVIEADLTLTPIGTVLDRPVATALLTGNYNAQAIVPGQTDPSVIHGLQVIVACASPA